jgi:hypothetical protein
VNVAPARGQLSAGSFAVTLVNLVDDDVAPQRVSWSRSARAGHGQVVVALDEVPDRAGHDHLVRICLLSTLGGIVHCLAGPDRLLVLRSRYTDPLHEQLADRQADLEAGGR